MKSAGVFVKYGMRSETAGDAVQYIEDLFCSEDILQKNVRRQGAEFYREGIQIRPHEARILQLLIHMNKVEKIVEIGTFMGYSTLSMVRALPEDGRLYTFEKNPDYAARAGENFAGSPYAERIQLFIGEALTNLTGIEAEGPFDMVFIDANKSGYPEYLHWAEKNLRPGGILVADNVFLFGKVYRPQCEDKMTAAMRRFNSELADGSGSFFSVIVPTFEGLAVAVKKSGLPPT